MAKNEWVYLLFFDVSRFVSNVVSAVFFIEIQFFRFVNVLNA